MAEWRANQIMPDMNLDTGKKDDPFIIYEADDVKRENALKLSTGGVLTVKSLVAQSIKDASGGSTVPVGAILMWSGPVSSIPAGWVLCDGQNGTPNLVSRFIRGAAAVAGAPAVGESGGSDKHLHRADAKVSVKEAGKHAHPMPSGWYSNTSSSGKGVHVVDWNNTNVNNAVTQEQGAHIHEATAEVAVQEASHLPSWYALCFIMKKA